MILINSIQGNVQSFDPGARVVDLLQLEWFETNKKIMRRNTLGGREIGWKVVKGFPVLQEGDILWMDDHTVIAVSILPAAAIVLKPISMLDMATICYEIGNKHLPLFIVNEEVLVPYEDPLFRWLEAKGYQPLREQRVLTNMLRSNVQPHEHGSGSTLFSKILQLTTKS
ncbi:urease accessory protein UreE [Chitinophaga silvisoli]|uniref:Urease accessory protein UreE n=1 Tax=Chitinophaga silvisoli TaxID=2291814 RepID=A0A3E1P715_9BACT|nr:urease accessory protein UreE [Chitinophaga silvisoli]RFM35979.1 urease accessory protein UreE [Chitinophaga silvisoli]